MAGMPPDPDPDSATVTVSPPIFSDAPRPVTGSPVLSSGRQMGPDLLVEELHEPFLVVPDLMEVDVVDAAVDGLPHRLEQRLGVGAAGIASAIVSGVTNSAAISKWAGVLRSCDSWPGTEVFGQMR